MTRDVLEMQGKLALPLSQSIGASDIVGSDLVNSDRNV
jgi:hypothetical protein